MDLFGEKEFFTGCNYWASHAGIRMWSEWKAEEVEKDLKLLAEYGMRVLRVFPLWPDFQPLTRFYGGCGWPLEFGQNGGALKNPAGVDEEMVSRFRFLCDTAEKNGLKLVVGLLTGWMSGRLFVPPALEGRNVLTDPDALRWEVRFVRYLVRELKDHPAVAAWDLGNECNCMGPVSTSAEAWNWMNAIASAIRLEDGSRPVVSGMHSISSSRRDQWNLQDQGELMDVLTTHPYPLFTPECNREPFNTMRNELHPSAESLLYEGVAGKRCFPEECGSLGPTICSVERAARNLRTSLFSCWANGLGGYLWWCAFDQSHLDYPPYEWTAIERELGLFRTDRSPKETVVAMRDFVDFRKHLPFSLPPRRVDAVCLISETENSWKSALGAFLLSRQAGFDLRFAGADQELPESDFYVLPSGKGAQTIGRRAWLALLEKVRSGAKLLLSLSGNCVLSTFREAVGVEIDARYQEACSVSFTLKSHPEEILEARGAYRSLVKAERAEVLAADADGNPMMTAASFGKGQIFFVNLPLEQQSVENGGCFHGENLNPLYLLYREAAERAGIRRLVKTELPGVGITEHPLENGKTVCVAINYEPEEAICPLSVSGRVAEVWNGDFRNGTLRIAGNDAAVLLIEEDPAHP